MQDNLQNRMEEGPRKRERGRPTNAELSARVPPIQEAASGLPESAGDDQTMPREGMACMHCGRHQFPRITNTNGLTRYVTCSLCGRRMRIDYAADFRSKVIHKL